MLAAVAAVGCDSSGGATPTPGLASRGTIVTTVKPTRQDLANQVSLSGTVTLDPVFGLAAPVAGQVRYANVKPSKTTPTKPTKVATVYSKDGKAHPVSVPAGAVFDGRLLDDRSTVTAGMPIVSAKLVGYGIVADIDGAQAYQISDSLGSVKAQVKGGPGPFACTPLGTIGALPAGVIPTQPPPAAPTGGPSGGPMPLPILTPPGADDGSGGQGSDPTGLRLVCTAPAGVRLINGAGATVQVVTAKATNVLVLPVEAVAGQQGKGEVDVVGPDGGRQTTQVVLGLTDGKMVEIKSGLTGEETIAVPGPDLPTPPPNTGGPDQAGISK
ncbi:efflux RND transporter periplasmic adaptor subunit [Rugosimonospora africana]|uniref:efflux RND transporter periplasmic adaptor subunit n=1 Tax=Rugosimonospora africana TaxID=556532 RepID=UPI001EF31633|nr:efflux RND transporter periplasmic adaptor subunit [Rugosimonospora africana]